MSDDVERFMEHIVGLTVKHGSCKLDVSFSMLVGIIGSLQLALRHPGMEAMPDVKQNIRQFVDDTIESLDSASPGIGEYLKRGDNPEYDRMTSN